MTDKAITQSDINRIKESWQGLTDYQEIITLATEQLEAKEYLRVAILLDEYRSMAEYFLDEIQSVVEFSKFHNPQSQCRGSVDAIAKCAHPESAHKPVHNSIPTDGQAD